MSDYKLSFLVTGCDHRPFWCILTIKILKYTFFWRFIGLHLILFTKEINTLVIDFYFIW